MSAQNLQLARKGFDDWFRGDFDAMTEMAVEDVEFVPAVASAVEGGAVRGRDDVRRFFQSLDETWESFRIDADEWREVGDRVLMVGRVRAKGRGSGVELDQPMFSVLWFREEKIARMQSFLDRDQAHEAAKKELEEAQ